MIPEIDIWRTAQLMIRQHGAAAADKADRSAGDLIEQGNHAGGAVWQRIRAAIEQLQQDNPSGPVH